MVEQLFIPLLILAFPGFWFLAPTLARILGPYLPLNRALFSFLTWTHNPALKVRQPKIHSAETTNGREAEFTDEELAEEAALIRSLRELLISLYFVGAIVYLQN